MASTIILACLSLIFLPFAVLFAFVYLLSTELPSFKVLRNTFIRDIKTGYVYFRFLFSTLRCHRLNHSVVDRFATTAEKYSNETCFIYQDQEWTFKQVDELSNRIANSFLSRGYKKGDEVALLMENCPDYVCMWLGLAKIGVVTALINTNLREDAFGHSINILDIKAIILGTNFAEVIRDAIPFLKKKDHMEYYCYAENNQNQNVPTSFPCTSLNSLLEDATPEPIDLSADKPGFRDKLFYIYTSGTTGLPKAAVIRHSRFIWIATAAKYPLRIRDFETFYNPLPMYHTAGAILMLGIVLMFGGKMVIRKKFSASNFWKEVYKHKVTVTQYIGEICRYLLNQPKIPEETQHCLRLMVGNGLRSHIWAEFQERFRIKEIIEFYGATEGNASIANLFGKVGAVGFFPRVLQRLFPVNLMKINLETGELMRDAKGLCIHCKPGEPGEIVGKIVRSNPLNSFDGYANEEETNKKIIRNGFKLGDTAYRSGDILVMDEEGYLYFIDRSGDTFRWKGENVSTGEVENMVSKALNHSACVVYGVEIPNTEGRAGMAAIQLNVSDINVSELYQTLTKKLPLYAVPLFIRVSEDLELTGMAKYYFERTILFK